LRIAGSRLRQGVQSRNEEASFYQFRARHGPFTQTVPARESLSARQFPHAVKDELFDGRADWVFKLGQIKLHSRVRLCLYAVNVENRSYVQLPILCVKSDPQLHVFGLQYPTQHVFKHNVSGYPFNHSGGSINIIFLSQEVGAQFTRSW
jgi:hypothetical protein